MLRSSWYGLNSWAELRHISHVIITGAFSRSVRRNYGHHDSSNIIPQKSFENDGTDPDRPIVLYCTGGTHIAGNEHLVIKHVHEVVSFKDKGNLQLLVRLHSILGH